LYPWIVNTLAFAAAFLTVFALNAILIDLSAGERQRVKKRMEEQFRERQRMKARTSPAQDFSKIAAEARAQVKDKTTLKESLEFLLEQSGSNLSLAQFVTAIGGMALVAAMVGGALGIYSGFGFGMSIPCAMIGATLPVLYIRLKRRRRLEKLRAQLPDAFELMSRVLRAGQTISQAMRSVADEFSRPIALEYLYCYEQMNLGLSPEAALREMARRTGLLEVKIFVLAVVVHRQTGGNLAELLDKLAYVVRERFRIRGMIQSLTAQGRLQAAILLSLPPAMFTLLMVLHPDYEKILLDYPGLIVLALSLMGLGGWWIRKIVNFDF
jgi:tight adherence protein B